MVTIDDDDDPFSLKRKPSAAPAPKPVAAPQPAPAQPPDPRAGLSKFEVLAIQQLELQSRILTSLNARAGWLLVVIVAAFVVALWSVFIWWEEEGRGIGVRFIR